VVQRIKLANKKCGSCHPSAAGCLANLTSENLSGAKLSGANLNSADLSGANLSGANLTGANLVGANLNSADLSGTNLGKVIWSDTTCPDGTNSNAGGRACTGHL
jgi:uncharacterized protein YjbI with pentapeptide repeats